jgi:hypothetical protein
MSWGGLEFPSEVTPDSVFVGSHVTFFAGAGDFGHGVVYPSASPYVVSVGGTTLHLSASGSYQNENTWSGSGGGLSSVEPEPLYQSTYPIPNDPPGLRGTPDVAYLGDPNSGLAVYNSFAIGSSSGWFKVGGTSAGAPQWAALFAIANSVRPKHSALTGSQGVLYDAVRQSSGYHDIINGSDGNCGTICKAQPGYDYATGIGSPRADKLIPFLAALP